MDQARAKNSGTKTVLPTPEVKLQLLKNAIERLTENNRYVYIGMDHFARPDDELAVAQKKKQLQRNFQGYSTRAGADIYAFGMSAISQIPDVYWQNEKELPDYYAALDAGKNPLSRGYFVTDEDKIRRETIMRVMCDLSLDYAAMSQKLGINFAATFRQRTRPRSRHLKPMAWYAVLAPALKSPTPDVYSSATLRCALTTRLHR